ncbi:MAG: UPF0164 family protein [bacterium]|nr:UPF0164 family protein [bacterium]
MIKYSLARLILVWIALIVFAALLGDVAIAGSDVGRTSADFLQIGQGARAAGLGGAYTAVSEGAGAAYWNPAGLSGMERSEVSLGHFAWFQDITVEQASLAVPLEMGAVVAASVTYVNYGTIEGYDISGAPTGDLTAYDWVGGISVGYPVTEALSIGLTGKFVNQRLDEYSASTFAADFALKYRFSNFAIGGAVTNIGGKMKFDEESEDLPSAARVGVAAMPFGGALLASLDVEQRFQGDLMIRQGLELGFDDRYFLRSGYDYLPGQDGKGLSTAISFGGGLRLDFAEIDYAYTPNDKSTSEDLHRFSVVLKIGH